MSVSSRKNLTEVMKISPISKDANYRCMGSFMSGNAFSRG